MKYLIIALLMFVAGCSPSDEGDNKSANDNDAHSNTPAPTPDSSAQFADLPEAPEGFRWIKDADAKIAFLAPKGWHEHAETNPLIAHYTLSKHAPDMTDTPTIHLLVGRYAEIGKHKGQPPSAMATLATEMISKLPGAHLIESQELTQVGDAMVGYDRSENTLDNGIRMMTHSIYIAYDDADVLCTITFEAPADEWNEAWTTYGQTLLDAHNYRLLP